MIIHGKYADAKVFTDHIEKEAIDQIHQLCDQVFVEQSHIRIMPDVHAGAGCTIGTTMTIKDKIVPNLVGVDIGCGMTVAKLKNSHIELEKLDKTIHQLIPSGFNVHKSPLRSMQDLDLDKLRSLKSINQQRAILSIGTLGGGNHFIELNEDSEENLYLVIHSGSRHLGLEVANYYQKLAYNHLDSDEKKSIPKPLAYLTGQLFDDYLHDMSIIQQYAQQNRLAIIDQLSRQLKLKTTEQFTTIHNYIDLDSMILRKGAVSAKKNEQLLIPLNMRDGSLICTGKGNPDWNFSAPHGAGRIMSRTTAKNTLNINLFKQMMKDVYSTSINNKTIDESPLAYRPMEQITDYISDTVTIDKHVKPLYNFKASN